MTGTLDKRVTAEAMTASLTDGMTIGINIFEFDDAGKVRSMRAYFGPTNFSGGVAPHA